MKEVAERDMEYVQQILTSTVFNNRKDAKKAAGRALGTIQEILILMFLEISGLGKNLVLEYPLPEYGLPEVRHKVDFTIHPLFKELESDLKVKHRGKILELPKKYLSKDESGQIRDYVTVIKKDLDKEIIVNNPLFIKRVNEWNKPYILMGKYLNNSKGLILELSSTPIYLIESKRVGLEEGTTTGPQTIEKAKQASYVALVASRLQKIRHEEKTYGIIFIDGKPKIGEYESLWNEILRGRDPKLLSGIVRTVTFISNHVNWFPGDIEKKDLKVLKRSFDWVIWIEDGAFSTFIEEKVLGDDIVKGAFEMQYRDHKRGLSYFTKSHIELRAYNNLVEYFRSKYNKIKNMWLKVLSPPNKTIDDLLDEIKLVLNVYNEVFM